LGESLEKTFPKEGVRRVGVYNIRKAMKSKVLLIGLLMSGFLFGGRYDVGVVVPGSKGSTVVSSKLNRPVSVNVRGVSLPYLFSLISQEARIPIILRDISVKVWDTEEEGQTGRRTERQKEGEADNEYLTVSYYSVNKPLWQVMDEITSSLDLWWKYENGRIVVYKYESRVFRLNLPFLNKKIEKEDDFLTLEYKRQFTKNLEKALSKLLRDKESKVSVDEMGNVYVYARKSEVEMIEDAVRKINKTFTAEIPLRIRVYLVREDDLKSLGLNATFRQRNISGGLSSPIPASPIFNMSIATARLEATLRALARTNRAKILEDVMLYALNGQPIVYAPLKKVRIISKVDLTYVSGTGGVGTTVPTITIDTEDINAGSTLIVVPYFIGKDKIAVDFYRKDTSIDEIVSKTVELAGATNEISLPKLSTRLNVNQTILKKGQTLVLFSGAMTLKELKDAGFPLLKDIPVIGFLFGGKEWKNALYRYIITITYAEERGNEEDVIGELEKLKEEKVDKDLWEIKKSEENYDYEEELF